MDLATLQVGTLKVGPQDTANCPFDLLHWFNTGASMLWNSSALKNYAPNYQVTTPTFEASSVYFETSRIGRDAFKSVANDGKGINFGSYAPCQTGTGTFVFLFSVPSFSVASNLYLTSKLLEAVGLQIRISTSGKVNLVKVNTIVFHTGSITLTAGKVHCIAVSYNTSTGAGYVYVDGVYDSTIASSQTLTHGTIMLLSNAYTVEDGTMRLYMAAVHPRVFPPDALQSLSANPWQLLAEEVDLFVNLRTSAVVTGKTPWPLLAYRRAA